MSTKPVRDVKIKAIRQFEKEDVDAGSFNKIGVNMNKSPKGLYFREWIGDA